MSYIYESYDSIDKLLQTINKRTVNKVFEKRSLSSHSGSEKFTGSKNYQDAVGLIKSGWDEPLKELKEKSNAVKVKTNVTASKARPRNSVVGYAPCVPAAILGLPESMIATERTPSKIKAVTIIYGALGHSGIKTSEFLKAGAVLLDIVNRLELQGYRVRVLLEFYAAEQKKERAVARVAIKDWKQPLDLKKITFPIAHGSMLRRIGFKWLETMPYIKESGWPSGYGTDLSAYYGYKAVKEDYEKNGLLTKNEYYINRLMVKDKGYDMDEVMKEAGMNL